MSLKKLPSIRRIMETKNYKLAWIYGGVGAEMPAHNIREESILLVQRGNAVLTFENQIIEMKKNDCHLIPGYAMHSLKISGDFEGLTIMSLNARLEFALPELIY